MDEKYHPFNLANCLRALYWSDIFSRIQKKDYNTVIECGVGRGRSLIAILGCLFWQKLNFKIPKITVYALDSFKGFPKPTNFDKSKRKPKKGDWAFSPSKKYKYSKQFLNQVLLRAGLQKLVKTTKIISGFFDRSLATLPTNLKIGVLHLDADLYLSTKIPLEKLSSMIVRGGVIVFDDFMLKNKSNKEKFPGSRKAFKDFALKNPNFYIECTVRGNPLLIKK